MHDDFSLPDLPMPAGHAQARQRALVQEISAPRTTAFARHRRLALAAAGVAAIAVALSVPATGHLTAAPASRAGTGSPAQLAAFTVVPGADGAVRITLRRSQDVDPAALTTAINQAGVHALVRFGVVCDGQRIDGIWRRQTLHNADGTHTIMISPERVPPGSLLVLSVPRPTDGAGILLTVSPAGTTPTCHRP
jgi:hypothetical protein